MLNSHLPSEVERTCDRVLFVRDGRLLGDLSLGAEERDLELDMRLDRVTPAVLEGLASFGTTVPGDGEIGSGVVETLCTEPVSRLTILLGKWLGCAALVLGYVAFIEGRCRARPWSSGPSPTSPWRSRWRAGRSRPVTCEGPVRAG